MNRANDYQFLAVGPIQCETYLWYTEGMRIACICLAVLFTLTPASRSAEPCVGHDGMVKCGPGGFPVCADGTTDRKFTCTRGKSREKRIGFQKRPDRGQILTSGETPPDTTLKESHKVLKN